MAQWELNDGAGQVGPLDEDHVIRMLQHGIPEQTVVRMVGESEWRSPRTHVPFAIALAQKAAPRPAPVPVQVAPAQAERVFYQDAAITITNSRAIMFGTTYPMANVTSVRMFIEPRRWNVLTMAIVCGLAGGLMVAIQTCTSVGLLLLLGAALAVLVFAFNPPKYWVQLGAAGGEIRACFFHERQNTERVVAAVNEAIIHRG